MFFSSWSSCSSTFCHDFDHFTQTSSAPYLVSDWLLLMQLCVWLADQALPAAPPLESRVDLREPTELGFFWTNPIKETRYGLGLTPQPWPGLPSHPEWTRTRSKMDQNQTQNGPEPEPHPKWIRTRAACCVKTTDGSELLTELKRSSSSKN